MSQHLRMLAVLACALAQPLGTSAQLQPENPQDPPPPRFFTDEAAFLRVAGTVVAVEGFESLPHENCGTGQTQTDLVMPFFSINIAPYILYPNSTETVFLCVGDANLSYDPGAGPTEGNNALIAGSMTGSTYNVNFRLDSPIRAVAFDYTDVAERIGTPTGISGNGNFEFFTENPPGVFTTISFCCSGPHEGFFGYVGKEPITYFGVRTQGRQDIIGLDRIQLALGHGKPIS